MLLFFSQKYTALAVSADLINGSRGIKWRIYMGFAGMCFRLYTAKPSHLLAQHFNVRCKYVVRFVRLASDLIHIVRNNSHTIQQRGKIFQVNNYHFAIKRHRPYESCGFQVTFRRLLSTQAYHTAPKKSTTQSEKCRFFAAGHGVSCANITNISSLYCIIST